jgi:hypothetical protein
MSLGVFSGVLPSPSPPTNRPTGWVIHRVASCVYAKVCPMNATMYLTLPHWYWRVHDMLELLISLPTRLRSRETLDFVPQHVISISPAKG